MSSAGLGGLFGALGGSGLATGALNSEAVMLEGLTCSLSESLRLVVGVVL